MSLSSTITSGPRDYHDSANRQQLWPGEQLPSDHRCCSGLCQISEPREEGRGRRVGRVRTQTEGSGLEGAHAGWGPRPGPRQHTLLMYNSTGLQRSPPGLGGPEGTSEAQTLGCGGSTRHNPSGRWKAVTVWFRLLGPRALLKPSHQPSKTNRHLDPPRLLRQKRPEEKGTSGSKSCHS